MCAPDCPYGLLAALGLLAMAWPAGDVRGQQQAAPQLPKMEQYVIADTFLGCAAWTYLAPESWVKQGGVGWTGRLMGAYYTQLSVRNPQALEEFAYWPIYTFADTNAPVLAQQTEVRKLTDAATCIGQIIILRCRPEILRGNPKSKWERLPELARATADQARAVGIANPQTDAARMIVEYTVGGRQIEEVFYCTVAAAPANYQNFGTVTNWVIDKAFSYRAEKGRLEAAYPVLATIAASLRESPEWVARRRSELARRVQTMSPPPIVSPRGDSGIMAVSRSMARDQDRFLSYIDRIHTDRMNTPGLTRWSEAFRGWSGYRDPTTGTRVDVPNGYNRYFQDALGIIHGTNDMSSHAGNRYNNAVELQPMHW
jgi:hypothetical protein